MLFWFFKHPCLDYYGSLIHCKKLLSYDSSFSTSIIFSNKLCLRTSFIILKKISYSSCTEVSTDNIIKVNTIMENWISIAREFSTDLSFYRKIEQSRETNLIICNKELCKLYLIRIHMQAIFVLQKCKCSH